MTARFPRDPSTGSPVPSPKKLLSKCCGAPIWKSDTTFCGKCGSICDPQPTPSPSAPDTDNPLLAAFGESCVNAIQPEPSELFKDLDNAIKKNFCPWRMELDGKDVAIVPFLRDCIRTLESDWKMMRELIKNEIKECMPYHAGDEDREARRVRLNKVLSSLQNHLP